MGMSLQTNFSVLSSTCLLGSWVEIDTNTYTPTPRHEEFVPLFPLTLYGNKSDLHHLVGWIS